MHDTFKFLDTHLHRQHQCLMEVSKKCEIQTLACYGEDFSHEMNLDEHCM